MSTRARVQAYLGMDVSGFTAGLQKANGLLAAFRRGFKSSGLGGIGMGLGGLGGGVASVAGIGALVMGFRSVMNAAQDAREEAKSLGMEVDSQTKAVAAYADSWDVLKDNIRDLAINGMANFLTLRKALGFGKNDEVDAAQKQSERDQKQREIDLKASRERIEREGASLDLQLSAARRANRMAELSEEQRLVAVNEEINALYERRATLVPKSNAAKKVELEIEQKLAEARELQLQISKRETADPSAMKGANTPFGMSVADVAGMREPGRRSERERLAAEAMRLEQRGRAAEAAGRFNLAGSFRDRAAELARRNGFGAMSGEVGEVRRSGGGADSRPGLTGAGRAAVSDWDARWGAQLAARNAALNARYGGDFKRPASFEAAEKNKKQEDAATKMENAAEKLGEAAEMLKEATIEVQVEES